MKDTKILLVAFVSALALSSAPALRGQDRREGAREEAHEHAEHAREYHFRHEDAGRLREHYRGIEHFDVAHRTVLVAGRRLPAHWRRDIRPVPVAVIRELPPPPAGYVFGYLDGYCVVYDPATLLIADVIDLATLPH